MSFKVRLVTLGNAPIVEYTHHDAIIVKFLVWPDGSLQIVHTTGNIVCFSLSLKPFSRASTRPGGRKNKSNLKLFWQHFVFTNLFRNFRIMLNSS